jgi:chemotaxis protein MotB
MQSKELAHQPKGPLPKPSEQTLLVTEQNHLIQDQQRHIALLEEELNLEQDKRETQTEPAQGLNFLMDNQEIQNKPVQTKDMKNKDMKNIGTSLALTPLANLTQTEQNQNIRITEEDRGVVISLKDNILFSPGEARLNATAKKTLDQLAATLKPLTQPIRVEGHSDNTPIRTTQYPSNWELSTARATEIVKYLVNQHKMSASKLSAAGYGEFKPIADNSTIEGKQKNRRVDIVVLDGSLASFDESKNPQNLKPEKMPTPNNPRHQTRQTSRIERKTIHPAEPSANRSLASVQRQVSRTQVSHTMEKPLEVEREKSWHDPQSQKI